MSPAIDLHFGWYTVAPAPACPCTARREPRHRLRQARRGLHLVTACQIVPLPALIPTKSNLAWGNKTCQHLCFAFQQALRINNTTEPPRTWLGRVAGSA
jgi:hypothetical protein